MESGVLAAAGGYISLSQGNSLTSPKTSALISGGEIGDQIILATGAMHGDVPYVANQLTLRPESISNAAESAGGRGVAFFGQDNLGFYTAENATLGAKGRSFFMMPLEDSAVVTNAETARLYTGMSPSTVKAYQEGGDIFGISVPTDGMEVGLPTAADARGWHHFLEGGHTAVRLEGPNAGYLVNPTREFVVPGGNAMPNGSVLFKVGPNGEWIPIRKF
jgi:hypothetical protein